MSESWYRSTHHAHGILISRPFHHTSLMPGRTVTFPKETRKRNGMIVITMTIPTISLSLRNLGSTLLHLQRANTEHWGDAQGLGPGYLELKYLLHRERYHSCAKNYAYSGTCPCKRVEFNTCPIHFAAISCPEMVNRLTWKYID